MKSQNPGLRKRKKRVRKNTSKTTEQVAVLKEFFEKNSGWWTSADLERLAVQLNLSKAQVYKYLWNLRKETEDREEGSLVGEDDSEQPEREQRERRARPKTEKVEVEDGVSVHIPVSLESAKFFFLPRDISKWAMEQVQEKGWQLVRE